MTGLPAVFLPYQQALMSAAASHVVTVVEKSRRTGYSWAAAAIAALSASSARRAGGQDVFYMGYNLEIAREFIDYVADWARQLSPAAVEVEETFFTDPASPEKDIKAFRVTFASGFKVLALPSVPRALRGMQGMVIVDEAAFHDDLDEVLKAAFALLIWGGRVLIISTHDGADNPFNTLVNDIRAGRKPYHLLRCTFDDALQDGLYRRICLKAGKTWTAGEEKAWRADIIAFYGDAAEEELFCVARSGGGAAIPAALVESRMSSSAAVLRYDRGDDFVHWPDHLRAADAQDWCEGSLLPCLKTLSKNNRHVVGVDFARNSDLTVFWPLSLTRDLGRQTPFTVELRNIPFRQQEQILFYLIDRLPNFEAGKLDARGNGQYLAEVAAQRYGARIDQVMLTESWYREHMPPLKAALEDGGLTLPKDDGILSDFRALRTIRGVIRVAERVKEGTGKRHGDSAIACALAYAASRAEISLYEYEALPQAARAPGPSRPAGKISLRANEDLEDNPASEDGLRGSV